MQTHMHTQRETKGVLQFGERLIEGGRYTRRVRERERERERENETDKRVIEMVDRETDYNEAKNRGSGQGNKNRNKDEHGQRINGLHKLASFMWF